MDRKSMLKKAFQRGHLLSLKNPAYRKWVDHYIVDEIRTDIGKGDITSDAVLKKNGKVTAIVVSKQNGIAAGIEEVSYLYRKYGIKILQSVNDGARLKNGTIMFRLEGKEKSLLKVERSALDVLQRMSGIATLTNILINKTKGKVGIAPTRKVEWRYMDKKAVFVGGGLTHRLALWDAILIKDNHLYSLRHEGFKEPIGISLERAWKQRAKGAFLEIEVANKNDAIRAAEKLKKLKQKNGKTICFIMFDNIIPNKTREIIKELKKKALYGTALFEASGGINPDNITKYANSGVDVVSLGYLTHSMKALDISQLIQR